MPNPISLVSDVLSNAIGNTTTTIATNVSDGVINGAKASISGVQNCIYKSKFTSAVDPYKNQKFGIVSDSLDGLNTVGCVCQNDENVSTNVKAVKLSTYNRKPFPNLSPDIYVCEIPQK